ncbi:hypothetical protein NE865_02528 [Phthorimaea operculella]|nr:hypothetical protein NE865_02528 [Phthorimaea operculella]
MLGPADLVFKRTEHCDPKCDTVDFWVDTRKYNRSTSVLDITITSPYPIDDDMILELKGSMKKEGGYKPGSFYYKDKACVVMEKMFGDMWEDVLKIAGADDCPLSTGTHEVREFYFDNDKFTVPQIWGEYKMETFFFRDDELIGCYNTFYDMVEKQ